MITPENIIEILGGIGATARECGVTPQAVTNWKSRGFIPPRHAPAIIAAARREGKTLKYDDFFNAA